MRESFAVKYFLASPLGYIDSLSKRYVPIIHIIYRPQYAGDLREANTLRELDALP